jgi:hypothetical protein
MADEKISPLEEGLHALYFVLGLKFLLAEEPYHLSEEEKQAEEPMLKRLSAKGMIKLDSSGNYCWLTLNGANHLEELSMPFIEDYQMPPKANPSNFIRSNDSK